MGVTDAEQIAYHWNGVRTPDGTGWQEHFAAAGKGKRLPPRDLTAGEVAAFTDTQKELLHSEAGQRLYTKAPKPPKPAKPSDSANKTEGGN